MKKVLYFATVICLLLIKPVYAGIVINTEDIPLMEGMWKEVNVEISGDTIDEYKIKTKIEERRLFEGINIFLVKTQKYEGIEEWGDSYHFKTKDKYVRNFGPDKFTQMQFPLIIGKRWVDDLSTIEQEVDGQKYLFVYKMHSIVERQESIYINNLRYETLKIKSELHGHLEEIEPPIDITLFKIQSWVAKGIGEIKLSVEENSDTDKYFERKTISTLLNYYIPPKADSDSDKIYDSLDKCPNTPQGETVDETGCTVIAPQEAPVPTLNQWGIILLFCLMPFCVSRRHI